MKKNAIKEHIIETASELFYAKGYNLVGINEIIAESNIAKATLYNHFKSKEDLCLAYLDHRDSILLNDMSEYCLLKAKGKKRIFAVLEFLLDFFNSKNFNGCWCLRTIAEVPKENKRIRNKIKNNKTHFLNFLESLVDDNLSDLSKKKRDSLSKRVYLLYEGALTESHLHNDKWPIIENMSLLKSILKEF